MDRQKYFYFVSAISHGRTEVVVFLATFAKLRKVSVNFIMSVCLSGRALETTLITLQGVS